MSAGEPINPEVMEQWRRKTGLDIYEGYGQTETVPAPLKTGLDVISQINKSQSVSRVLMIARGIQKGVVRKQLFFK